ncbi:MAG: hypothetical protein AAB553_06355 [Patescibacteria group bacterium]
MEIEYLQEIPDGWNDHTFTDQCGPLAFPGVKDITDEQMAKTRFQLRATAKNQSELLSSQTKLEKEGDTYADPFPGTVVRVRFDEIREGRRRLTLTSDRSTLGRVVQAPKTQHLYVVGFELRRDEVTGAIRPKIGIFTRPSIGQIPITIGEVKHHNPKRGHQRLTRVSSVAVVPRG